MSDFELINETNIEIPELPEIREFMEYATNYLKLENAIFSIIIVDNQTIWQINKTYRKIDRPTDVISFALEDNKDFIEPEFRVLGDIYISIDKAKEQAEAYGHSLKRELAFLSIHGLLHLLGYDHMTAKDEKVMFELQELILNEYGIKR